jgi:hypothetical protein
MLLSNSLEVQYPPSIEEMITKDRAKDAPGVALNAELAKAKEASVTEMTTSEALTPFPLILRMVRAEINATQHRTPENKLALSPGIRLISGKRKAC